ncbi:MAG: hypothetical protein ACFNZS_10460 [Ottowia sp.]
MPLLKDAAAPKLLGGAGPRTKAAGKAAFLMACPQGGAGWLARKSPARGGTRTGLRMSKTGANSKVKKMPFAPVSLGHHAIEIGAELAPSLLS